MITYLLISAFVTFVGGLLLFGIFYRLVNQGVCTGAQGRGFFVIALTLWVLVASVLDYFVANPYSLFMTEEQRVVPMMLVNSAVAVIWLLLGAAHLENKRV